MGLIFFSAVLSTFMLAISISNLLLLRRTGSSSTSFIPSVAVLLPLRDEKPNLEALISSLKTQLEINKIAFHLVDDNSSDGTYEIAARLTSTDSRFFLHEAPELKEGWLGKPATMQFGLLKSDSEIVVVIDADVRLAPHAIQRALSVMQENSLDFISAYPRQVANTWSELLIQPLLQWSWMSSVPLRIAEKSSNPALCVANGQFFAVRREALESVGGFNAVKSAVIDDISLARVLVGAGFHGTVIDGSNLASCRMYASWQQLRDGYGKSLHLAFGGILGTLIASLFLFLTGILPIVAAFMGSKLALYCLVAVAISRVISAITSRGNKWSFLLHPISILVLLFLIVRSWKYRTRAQWKGRQV